MSLLHIYDSSFRVTRWIAGRRGGADRHGVGSYTEFTALFTRLRDEGRSFDRILIESHGSPGRIGFGRSTLGPLTWRSMKQAGYTGLARSGGADPFQRLQRRRGAGGLGVSGGGGRSVPQSGRRNRLRPDLARLRQSGQRPCRAPVGRDAQPLRRAGRAHPRAVRAVIGACLRTPIGDQCGERPVQPQEPSP